MFAVKVSNRLKAICPHHELQKLHFSNTTASLKICLITFFASFGLVFCQESIEKALDLELIFVFFEKLWY